MKHHSPLPCGRWWPGLSLVGFVCLLSFTGCQSRQPTPHPTLRPQVIEAGEGFEVRVHSLKPGWEEKVEKWTQTIQQTVVPVDWNGPRSPHRIEVDDARITIRTTRANQEVILEYLTSVIEADIARG